MLHITDAQKAALDRERRQSFIKRVDDWLLKEDRAWPRAAPEQRHGILDSLLVYSTQSGMSSERDHAVFCRAAILLRSDWQAFIEAEPQKSLLLDESLNPVSKLRAFYNRAEITAKSRAAGGPAR